MSSQLFFQNFKLILVQYTVNMRKDIICHSSEKNYCVFLILICSMSTKSFKFSLKVMLYRLLKILTALLWIFFIRRTFLNSCRHYTLISVLSRMCIWYHRPLLQYQLYAQITFLAVLNTVNSGGKDDAMDQNWYRGNLQKDSHSPTGTLMHFL